MRECVNVEGTVHFNYQGLFDPLEGAAFREPQTKPRHRPALKLLTVQTSDQIITVIVMATTF